MFLGRLGNMHSTLSGETHQLLCAKMSALSAEEDASITANRVTGMNDIGADPDREPTGMHITIIALHYGGTSTGQPHTQRLSIL